MLYCTGQYPGTSVFSGCEEMTLTGAGQCFWLGRSRHCLCSLLAKEMPRKDNSFLCSCKSEAWLPVPSSGEGLPFLWDVWAKSSSCSCSGGGVNAATALPKPPVLCQTQQGPGEGCSHVGAWWHMLRCRALGTASSSCCKQQFQFSALG